MDIVDVIEERRPYVTRFYKEWKMNGENLNGDFEEWYIVEKRNDNIKELLKYATDKRTSNEKKQMDMCL
jgi:hypothetical protein